MRPLSLRREVAGTTAVEFAILLPAFLALVVGSVNVAIGLFTVTSLNFAVQQAARCASVDATDCGDADAIQTYAGGRFYAPGHPTFVYTASACGNLVSGAIDYRISAIVASFTVPISASACFP
jgi:hypothetical protein